MPPHFTTTVYDYPPELPTLLHHYLTNTRSTPKKIQRPTQYNLLRFGKKEPTWKGVVRCSKMGVGERRHPPITLRPPTYSLNPNPHIPRNTAATSYLGRSVRFLVYHQGADRSRSIVHYVRFAR